MLGLVDPLMPGLDDVDWSDLAGAYGPAVRIPSLIRGAATGDGPAVTELWGTVCHQGTVYDCTRYTVPFLARLAVDPGTPDTDRAQAAFLLASIAAATSFVLPDEPVQMHQARWLRQAGDSEPVRDLLMECRGAVAGQAGALVDALPRAPSATRAGLVAALAAVASDAPDEAARAVQVLNGEPNRLLAAAAEIIATLATGDVAAARIEQLSTMDDEAADYLSAIANWPSAARAVELTRELCERAAWAE